MFKYYKVPIKTDEHRRLLERKECSPMNFCKLFYRVFKTTGNSLRRTILWMFFSAGSPYSRNNCTHYRHDLSL